MYHRVPSNHATPGTDLSLLIGMPIPSGMKPTFPLLRCAFSLFIFLNVCQAQVADLADTHVCGCTNYEPNPSVNITLSQLSPEEKVRYERGIALNKEIALYGLNTLRHYKAQVVSIKPAADGTGAEIELRAQTALIHKNGAPWCTFEQRPTSKRTLRWLWRDSHPVPVFAGLWVSAYADAKDNVQRVSQYQESYITAIRETMPQHFWELCIKTYATPAIVCQSFERDAITSERCRNCSGTLSAHRHQEIYSLLQPNYVNLAGLVGEGLQVEWTVKHGLAISHFTPRNPAIGGDGVMEKENHSKNWPGFALINVAGRYVRPGRDGWQKLGTVFQTPYSKIEGGPDVQESYWNVRACRLTNPDQFIATSVGWDVLLPWAP